MPRPELRKPATEPQRRRYEMPRPWVVKAVSDGFAIFAANDREVMRFTATANPTAFPESRTLEEAKAHAERTLDIMEEHAARIKAAA